MLSKVVQRPHIPLRMLSCMLSPSVLHPTCLQSLAFSWACCYQLTTWTERTLNFRFLNLFLS